jgi:hypothetical protein
LQKGAPNLTRALTIKRGERKIDSGWLSLSQMIIKKKREKAASDKTIDNLFIGVRWRGLRGTPLFREGSRM